MGARAGLDSRHLSGFVDGETELQRQAQSPTRRINAMGSATRSAISITE
ncbi:MAG: hypothetical protein AVDCRST_MAG53-1633 [uncultured Solirubrobacteraceae bacterium]|uniref:Uncharacterized protein n=1 Tax=uncultured Solirubrobacteraceae bacterium TaxID=1162706 RepID=A0A6J4SFS1_9ACTN|nr:MAG: hypothetical protein AVDCRST_MAG53-1633 [uncultured Solirubrobacteraceae bacterium]